MNRKALISAINLNHRQCYHAAQGGDTERAAELTEAGVALKEQLAASPPGIQLLVCGGREFTDAAYIEATLDTVHATRPIEVLIAGGARGVDTLAAHWAHMRGIECKVFPAQWGTYGKTAGAIRNQQMIREGKPDRALIFPGNYGTLDMLKRVRLSKIPYTLCGRPTDRWGFIVQGFISGQS